MPALALACVLALAGCDGGGDAAAGDPPAVPPAGEPPAGDILGTESATPDPDPPRGVVTLGFAGDVHFEYHLRGWLSQPELAFGSMRPAMKEVDLMMVNLESAITERGTEEAKELEVRQRRHHFRVAPSALDLLAGAGVDVLTMANNHGADYGPIGLRDSLAAIRRGPIPVVGIGKDRTAAFRPYRVTIRGTDFAFLGADASKREGASSVWAAGPANPGIAAAHAATPRALLAAVRAAARRDDVVVVYLHWGREGRSCPTQKQVDHAWALSEAGADIVVGAHAHVLLGSGWMGDTYVNYGLGNYLWYHQRWPGSGMLRLRVEDGEVVDDTWLPARLLADGPELLPRPARAGAVADWQALRGCAVLADAPPR
jgi:poly-gamma-glutamate synthesis protein (capsule biosynthesis protein)